MSGKIVTSNTVQEPVNENERVAPCEENNRVVLNESNSGKILIEVSLSRQNVHEYEITQIIKEIFELNNHDLEVEKVVMPIGQDTWQIRKATIDNLIESDTNLTKKQKSPQQSSMKLVNHKKMYKLAPQNLTKLKHSLRKKLNEKNLLEETLTRTVSEVHSSTAVTNLLSQLYPNPYNLINLMELADETGPTASTETLDVSSNDKAKLTTNNAPPAKEGEKEAKIIPPAEGQPTITHRDPETAETVKKDREEIKPVADQSGTDHKSQERSTSRKVKRMKIPSEDRLITISEDVAADIIAKKHESHAEPKPRSKNSEVTAEDKGKLAHKKHTSKSGDSLKVHEKPPSKKRGGEKSVSVIHPFSIIKKTPPSEEGRDSSLKVGSVQEVSEDRLTPKKKGGESEKNKCVMQYLKLIKDLYEAEEKDLQDKIDGAWNYMLNVDAPIKRQGKSKFHHHTSKFFTGRMNDKSWKNCPLQSTMSDKKGKSIECREVVDQTRNLEVPVMTLCETVPRPVFPTRSDSLNTWIGHTPFRYHLNINNISTTACPKTPIIQTDIPLLKRKGIPNEMNPLPIEVLNKSVYETDKKIDLLIRHIENSMNRLSQSEKSNTCNVGSLMNTPGDLPHRLEKNLGKYKTGLKSAPEDRAYFRSGNNSNLLINQSFRSLHIFPMDNGIKSVKISSDALFKNQLSGRNRDYLWWQTNMIKSTSVGDMGNTNLMTPVRSIDYPRQTVRSAPAQAVTRETARRTTDRVGREITEIPCTNTTIRFEVPEIPLGSEPIMVSVESANELGGYTEVGNPSHSSGSADSIRTRRTRDPSRISLSEVKTLLDAEESLANQSKNDLELSSAPSSLSISILELGQELTALKPVVVQEITWNFSYLPVPTPVTHVHYRNERNLVFERMETQVLFVAMPTYFSDLATWYLTQTLEQELKQYSSALISHRKSSDSSNCEDGECEVFENCVATIDPHEANSLEDNFGNSASDEDPNGVKVLKKAESLSARKEDDQWDSFPSGSSSEFCDAEKRRVDIILQRPNRELDRHSENFPWLHQLPDPYESNPPDDDTDNGDGPKKQNDNSQTRHLRYSWGDLSCRNTPKQKVTGFAPHIFRYLSSDASTGSVNDSNTYNSSIHTGNTLNSPKGNALATVEKSPEIPQHKIEIPMQDREPKVDSQKYDEDEDSSSTSSFKSSNDYSDMSELQNTNSPRKKSMSRSYLLGKLFHELRHFRKYLLRRKSLKRKPAAPDDRKEFEEALTELPDDGKALVGDQKEKVDEAIAVNTLCVDEVTLGENQAFPRKVFKTSFRGKESVTELMIDLKDVCISEVSDISVEKRKLSTDHTKISIVIKKQNDCNRDGRRTGKPAMVSPKSSYHSLHEVEGLRLRDRGDSGEEESDDEDDDDYKSAGSSVRSNSSENMDRNLDEQFRRMCDNIGEPRKKSSSYNRHRFDYYKRMDNASSVDSLNLNGRGVLVSSKYEKELAPLKKALTDMQLRIRNIQRNSYTTSDEYYERALRMAKMSVGYCQSCKSKAVIPEDPLGIYRKFIPRSWLRSQYGKQREYYFRTTSSTNSSFYSVQSSNSHNKFCRLSSSSSLFANGLRRSGGSSMRDTPTPPVPIFISRNTNF